MITINQLDPSQSNVLMQLLSLEKETNNNVSVVYGPPGTGKSHLIVSLLFELAKRNKKILFVSQNTEALEVINRMVKKFEHSLFDVKSGDLFDSSNISLTDFFLMLGNSKQRTKKFIKESYNRISAKHFPIFYERKTELLDAPPYNLSYTNLDKDLNENVEETQEIGFDELLFNYLKNVKVDDFPYVPIRDLQKINIRKIFTELNSFNDTCNLFSSNNHPTDVLRFISKTNSDIALPQVHSEVSKIIDCFLKIPNEKLKCRALKDCSIIDILGAYKNISLVNTYFDIKKIQQDNISIIDDLFPNFQRAIAAYDKIENVESVESIDLLENEILQELDISLLTDSEKTEECSNDINKALEATSEIVKTELKEFNLEDALSICVRTIDSKIFKQGSIINQTYFINKDVLYKYLEEILITVNNWNEKSILYKIFHSRPAILDKCQITSTKAFVVDDKPTLESILAILKETTWKLTDVLIFYDKERTRKTAYNPLDNKSTTDKIDIFNKIIIIYDIVNKYKIQTTKNIDKLNTIFKKLKNDFVNYNSIVAENIGLAGHHSELISLINMNVRNVQNNNVLFPIIKQYAKYLYAQEDKTDFIEKLRLILNLQDLDLKNELQYITNTILVDSNVSGIDKGKVLEIIPLLMNNRIFCKNFLKINKDESIIDWRERIKNILNFQDSNAFDKFIIQNKVINTIKKELGKSNEQIVDKFLENDNVTYSDFLKKLTNDLVKAKFNTSDIKTRQNIGYDYFVKYKRDLKNGRKTIFLKGLKDICEHTEQARKNIKTDSNWIPGNTPIERLQRNTKLLISAFPIIIATPKEVAKYVLAEKNLFDYVIFDEASQLLPGQALPSIYRSARTIVVGDPHQMPPPSLATVGFESISEDEDISNEKSILDLAIELQTETTHYLQVHYRSESNMLFEPSINAIYKEYGVQSIFESGLKNDVPDVPISIQDNLGDNDEVNFKIIAKEIEDKLTINHQASFCLLFTNKKTLFEFKDYLVAKNLFNNLPSDQLLISTVRNCQGIENDHSIIYLNQYKNIGAMWFFKVSAGAYRRLNVSITRQRKSLKIFMANPKSDWLSTCNKIIADAYEDKDRIRSAKLLSTIIEKSKYEINEQYVDDLLKDNALRIDSPLTQQLYDKLCSYYSARLNKDVKIYCEVGWLMRVPDRESLQRHRKYVGFRLDIGIYSKNKQCFVLGIEMDGAMYHKGHRRAFCDAQRQETLETKGWEVYRIWSTNWINSIDSEFNKLVVKIDKLL
ncbi:MAG: hypothetical protein LE180_02710 [Endomicrobium sp.]|uniref:AAA domain-containing protein n=1 Tax=Candidatus Endomicrobiellum pyrsonymphae TaxID=1408203 RepID=UPI00357A9451|nr:hypothetical protein [Endomicrobium sp.]